jgi:uncharacterized membrane protein YhaH (DUF805 family)
MRLLCRSCATNLEMALSARAEDAAKLRAERVDAARARRGLQPAGAARSRAGTDAIDPPPLWGFGWNGRLGRLNYATGVFTLLTVLTIVHIIAHGLPLMLGGVVSMLALVAVCVMGFRLAALRFHDRGHSGWWNMIVLLPVLPALVASSSPARAPAMLTLAFLLYIGPVVYLLFFRGDDDDNAYGSPPREGNGLALLGSILAMFAVGAFAPQDATLMGRLPSFGSDEVEVAERLRSVEARRAYIGEYLSARDHKAFAASPDGSWGWVSEARTSDAAISDALGTCEKHRPATQRPCEVVSVDGRPVPP